MLQLLVLILLGSSGAPDYSKPESWAARPETLDAADVNPPGVSGIDPKNAGVDVFFIYPTSYHGLGLNAAIDDATVNERTDEGSLKNQASVFNGCCRVFAPRYRQAALSTYVWRSDAVAEKAWALAYDDVKRAFDDYLQRDNHGRPFIIASHSQGSRYALWLLQDRIDGTALRDRFVAAYIIGYGIPADWFTRNLKTIGICQSATEVGCVISWNTFGEGGNTDRIHNKELSRYGDKFESNKAKRLVCTNPLTWTTSSEKADRSLNKGAWVMSREGKTNVPRANITGARCDDGALLVDNLDETPFHSAALPGKNYHIADYQLFYMNVRENAVIRSGAFLSAQSEAKK